MTKRIKKQGNFRRGRMTDEKPENFFYSFKRGRFSSESKTFNKKGLFYSVLLFSLFLVLPSAGCQPNSTILNSQKATPAPVEKPQDNLETAMRGVRSGNFTYVLVIRRKDGGKFDAEDKRFVKTNTPGETNQFVLTDEERTIIAASNFPFPPENLETLRERLTVEDHSEPQVEQPPGGNTNM